ncbi:MAG TPA: beta-ketoacyl-[acyl-carrier-protein] synthase family protein [Gammaproteobacteria bacterium]|nr:beta-ketoacyl-[acyl-carrier-protein] synthase family protein [Gammaproteobacteria bacterium]
MSALYLSSPGLINALGPTPEEIWKRLLAGSQQGMVRRDGLLMGGEVHVGAVSAPLSQVAGDPRFDSRNNRLLYAAYRQIATPVQDLIARHGRGRIAVVLGSSTSGVSDTETALQNLEQQGSFPPGFHYYQHEMGSPALFLASLLRLENAAMTISTACSSSAKAFVSARNLIKAGICDAALVGGVDTLCKLTINGFHALESVSPRICNPFSRNRDGITIGEAAALFILSPEPSAIELAGTGESADAYHMSAPDPSGAGAETVMRQALGDAGIAPAEIGYVNLHGTATPKNDEMEAAAVNRVFGEGTPCSSTKALTGHTLGAAGATELGLCWLALSGLNPGRALPPHVWDGTRDERLAAIKLAAPGDVYADRRDCYMMSNSFAFGGSNVSLIIKRNAVFATGNNQ